MPCVELRVRVRSLRLALLDGAKLVASLHLAQQCAELRPAVKQSSSALLAYEQQVAVLGPGNAACS